MLLLLPLLLPGDSSALAANTATVQHGASKMLLPASRLSAGPMVVSPRLKLMRSLPKQHVVQSLRGGAISSSLVDYSSAASDLFGNMRTPASIVGGAIVPMGFVLKEKVGEETKLATALRRAYTLFAVASFTSQLISVVYSSIAVNKLAEVGAAPTKNVYELLSGTTYQLPWIGCNVHFFLGLFGVLCMVGIRVFLETGGKAFGAAGAFIAASAFALMTSIMNRGVAAGDGTVRSSSNVLSLVVQYIRLILVEIARTRGAFQILSFGFALAALVSTFRMTKAAPSPA